MNNISELQPLALAFGLSGIRSLVVAALIRVVVNIRLGTLPFLMMWVALTTMSMGAVSIPNSFTVQNLSSELLAGAVVAWPLALIAGGMRMAGDVLGYNWGFGFGGTVSPLVGEMSSPTADLAGLVGTGAFLASGGIAHLGAYLAQSHRVFRPFSEERDAMMVLEKLVESGALVFRIAIEFAAPYLVLGIAIQFVFGVLSKAAPSLNAWGLGFVSLTLCGYFLLQTILPDWFHRGESMFYAAVHGRFLPGIHP